MASTPLLGLSLPADGTTNWGTLVNTSITALLDSAVAGTTTLSTDADVTLTATTEATNQARQAILLCTGARAAVRTITAPAQSKTYVIINATSGSYGVKIVGVGPTTGITVPNGKAYMVAWNGSDFVVIGTTTINLATDVTGILPVANGGTGLGGATPFTANSIFYASSTSAIAQSANLTFANNNLNVNSVAVGRGAFNEATNTAVGSSALASVASSGANYCVAVGYNALNANVNGPSNTAIGADSQLLQGNGSANTSVGALSSRNNVSGVGNTSVGASALRSNTGSSQTAIGANAMYYMVGSSNTAVGLNAMYGSAITANNTGVGNVAVGTSTLYAISSGQYNIAIGYNAGSAITSANYNVAVGQQSLISNQTGGANTAVGWGSLYGATGSFNVGIGANAGFAMLGGSKNTIIGSFSGNQGGLDIRSLDNYIVLADGDGNPRAYWNGANATFNGQLTLASSLKTSSSSNIGSGTLTPDSNANNQVNYQLSGITTFAAPSGTPANGQKLLIRIYSAAAYALTWNAIYRVIGTTLPTTTVAGKTIYVGCIYNSDDSKWDVVAVTTQA